jgi:large subunit ribosomal protein L18
MIASGSIGSVKQNRMKTDNKVIRRRKIRYSIRRKIQGSPQRPRLSVFRSNTDIYAQLIDDVHGQTLAAASSKDNDLKSKKATKVEISKLVGSAIAGKALGLGISSVVFDRSGYLYHGRVKALAEGAREGGLQF